ncbi:MAG: hypothetical protein GOVbin1434_8 [Prokaryotic dsDNA virus sp.]|nr:MAG: hypothetical protein GOVbin1434_8 [Prokaryotic dsDNA virus sp.]|tara:strand:- start:1346 stop:1531 length:186 start_codon:yes stop_codon:yes gene_type:complete
MSDEELKDMYEMLKKVTSFIEKNTINVEPMPSESAFQVPEEVYDEICKDLDIEYITLFGLS